MALSPGPVIGTAKALRLSALTCVLTVTVAFSGDGHADGDTPPSETEGNHGQLCWGENEIVIEQLWSGANENDAPGESAQLSCSVKFAVPLKSLAPNGLVIPVCGLNEMVNPESGVPDKALLVNVIVWVLGADPSN